MNHDHGALRAHRMAGLLAGAVLALIVSAGPGRAQADPAVDNAIQLDPFDPVPEIQFRHYGGNPCYEHCERHDWRACGDRCRPHCADGYRQGDEQDRGPRGADYHDGDHRDGDHGPGERDFQGADHGGHDGDYGDHRDGDHGPGDRDFQGADHGGHDGDHADHRDGADHARGERGHDDPDCELYERFNDQADRYDALTQHYQDDLCWYDRRYRHRDGDCRDGEHGPDGFDKHDGPGGYNGPGDRHDGYDDHRDDQRNDHRDGAQDGPH